MVKLEEVQDEAFVSTQGDEEGDWDTDDTESEVSDVSDTSADETLYERLAALKDVIPPQQRRKLTSTLSTTTSWTWWGVSEIARVGWIVTASLMLVAVPYGIASAEDQQIALQEKEMQMQQSANEVIAPGATTQQQSRQGL